MGRLSWNELENVDLHRHIINQNDPMTKPDLMVMVPDLYRRRRRRQGRRRLPRHLPESQGRPYCDISYLKKILLPCQLRDGGFGPLSTTTWGHKDDRGGQEGIHFDIK